MRILVRGSGVAGLAVAHEMSGRGAGLVVAENGHTPEAAASFYAGGMLAPYCEREAAPEDVLTLGRHAADWWEAATPGLVMRKGTLVVAPARDLPELTRFARCTQGHEWLDAEAIASLEPALAGRFRKALYFADEAHLDPRAALSQLRAGLERRGVAFENARPPESDESRYDRVINCIGSAAIGSLDGLRGVRGEMLYLQTDEVSLSRPVRLLHPRHPLYIVPRGQGLFMVGATMIESNASGAVSARSLMELLNAAYAVHPAFGEARVVELGAGIRPAFADNLPRVIEKGHTIHINGLYRHGFLLAPAMAGRAAEMILAKTSPQSHSE